MQKVEGDIAAVIASNLAQAEMALRAAKFGTGSANDLAHRHTDVRAMVRTAYEHWLAVVTTGNPPRVDLD